MENSQIVYGRREGTGGTPQYWGGYANTSLPTPPPSALQQHPALHHPANPALDSESVSHSPHVGYAYSARQPSATYWATTSPHFPDWVPPALNESPAFQPPPYEHILPIDDSLITAPRIRHHSQASYLDGAKSRKSSHSERASDPEIIDFTVSNGVLAGSLQGSLSPVASTSTRRRTVSIDPSAKNDGARVPRPKAKRTVVEIAIECTKCHVSIARLLLRGTAEEHAVAYTPIYSCTTCSPSAAAVSDSHSSPMSDSVSPSDGNTSGGSGRPVKPVVNQPAAPFRKRSRRPDDPSAHLTCDVCLRDVATGGIVANDSQSSTDLAIETICVRCAERYRRCSDCGGGGGNRIAVGKWRSKELFAATRKTCELSHLRLGSLSETYFDVWNINSLPVGELDMVVAHCKRIFHNTMMAAICIPEVLETKTALVTSYAECKVMGERGWINMETMIRVDVEKTRQIRRFLAMRFCTPHPRKTKSKVAEVPAPIHDPANVMRQGKDLMGFVIAEHDLVHGTMFLAVVAPWAMADMNDPAAVLIQALLTRADVERIESNIHRVQQGLTPYPPIIHVWTMLFFKRDSRMMNHMERTRGFSPLDEYMDAYSGVDATAFPPHREVYIPLTRMEGWQVLVRSQTGDGKDNWHPRRAILDRAKKATLVDKDRHRG